MATGEDTPRGEKHRTDDASLRDGSRIDPGTGRSGGDATAAPERSDASEEGMLLGADSDVRPILSVVMPTLNEEAGVAECIERIESALETLGVPGEVVVSDASTDRTPEIAREMGAVVVEPDEPGYGYAYRYAFERCRGEYIAMGDADTTYDFAELPKLFEHVVHGDADIAMGSRLEGEIKAGAMPSLHRYVGNPLLTRFLNTFYDTDVSDAHSGMRVLTRDALERMDLDTSGMEFASEMVMEAGARDLTIVEEPITYHEREGEATLDSFRDGWRHVRFMLENAPGYLFTAPGLAMTLFGTVVALCALLGMGVGPMGFGVHSLIAGCLLTLVGLQVVSMGVFTKVTADPIRSPPDPLTSWVTDRVSLEYGATAGLVLVVAGGAYAVGMVGRWVATGFRRLPLLYGDIVAMTLVVAGLLVGFNAFFLSAIAEE
jgi:hypothetical protein